MKRLLPVLLLLLLGACSETVEVTIQAPTSGWEVYGVDTVLVACHPVDRVGLMELLVDSSVAGVDTYPEPYAGGFVYRFAWDVTKLGEASVHRVQARAISGSREYLSPELSATVGYRTRLLVDGNDDSVYVHRPDGVREAGLVLLDSASPAHPSLRSGCSSVVFVADRKLYETPVPNGPAQLLETIANGIYGCDVSPASDLVVFEGYPAATAHLFTRDNYGSRVQLTHDSDFVLIDSSRFTCTANSDPVFSPDGSKLAYCRKSKCLVSGDPHEGETREDVFVMDRNGSNPVNLTADLADGLFGSLTWTFDGKWVLFREGSADVPNGVYASRIGGRTISGLAVSPLAMACSPTDSTLAYIGTDLPHQLYSVGLVWTDDTLYVDGAGLLLNGGSFGNYIDWARYSK